MEFNGSLSWICKEGSGYVRLIQKTEVMLAPVISRKVLQDLKDRHIYNNAYLKALQYLTIHVFDPIINVSWMDDD